MLDVNLAAPERITTELLDQKLIRSNGRVIGVASIAGIAGNLGQTNYATSKAGVIGFVDAFSHLAADQGVTVNAVAPGFIETQMTASIPLADQRGRAPDELDEPGWSADRRRRDRRLVRAPRLVRCHRQRRSRVRAEPARCLRWSRESWTSPPRWAASTSGLSCRREGGPTPLPDLRLELPDMASDPAHIAAYREVCGLPFHEVLPATYPHVLAFPLHLALLTDTDFPFPPMGCVHIRNRIEQRRPIDLADTLDLAVWAERLTPHRRGRTVTIVSEAAVAGEVVWRDETVLLKPGPGSETVPGAGV